MKKILLIMAVITSVSFSLAETVTLKSLITEMADRESLTRMPKVKYEAKAATSYDRKSKVNNPVDGLYVERNGRDWGKGWFANYDFDQFARVEKVEGRTEKVMMDAKGPGAIVRMWIPATTSGFIRIYLDGKKEPVIAMKANQLIGNSGLVGQPFSFRASDDKTNPAWRAHNLYLPIPYQNGCKVTYEGKPGEAYYQINYRKYAKGTIVKTFTKNQLKKAKKVLDFVGNKLTSGNRNVSGKSLIKEKILLKSGESSTHKINKGGAVTKISVQLDAVDYQQALRSTVVSLNFDGKKTAWIPLGSLMGIGYSDEKNDTYFINVDKDSRTLDCYYVMPFKVNAEITLKNYGDQSVEIKSFELVVNNYKWTKSSNYFHATWFEQRNISTQSRSDLNFLTVKGSGRFVGCSITIFNTCTLPNNQTWWGEGDDKFYVDGETFPSIFGTGTEDYFGYAYCRPQRYYTPFISQPRGEGNKKTGYSNNNRYHMLDDVPFNESLKFDMEIWHPFKKNMNYAAATFFYANKESVNSVILNTNSVKHKVALTRDDVLNSQ